MHHSGVHHDLESVVLKRSAITNVTVDRIAEFAAGAGALPRVAHPKPLCEHPRYDPWRTGGSDLFFFNPGLRFFGGASM